MRIPKTTLLITWKLPKYPRAKDGPLFKSNLVNTDFRTSFQLSLLFPDLNAEVKEPQSKRMKGVQESLNETSTNDVQLLLTMVNAPEHLDSLPVSIRLDDKGSPKAFILKFGEPVVLKTMDPEYINGICFSLRYDPRLLTPLVPHFPKATEEQNAARLNTDGNPSPAPDFKFIVGDAKIIEYPVHKEVLNDAYSFFNKITFDKNHLKIENVKPSVVKAWLDYIYTGKLPEKFAALAGDLLSLAYKYEMDELKEECTRSLMDQVTKNSVKSIFNLFRQYDCEQGKLWVFILIKLNKNAFKNSSDILDSYGFQDLLYIKDKRVFNLEGILGERMESGVHVRETNFKVFVRECDYDTDDDICDQYFRGDKKEYHKNCDPQKREEETEEGQEYNSD